MDLDAGRRDIPAAPAVGETQLLRSWSGTLAAGCSSGRRTVSMTAVNKIMGVGGGAGRRDKDVRGNDITAEMELCIGPTLGKQMDPVSGAACLHS